MPYRADIDGLRALAIVTVVLYHAFPQLLPGGFVGVDVFFVISGFLISGIIFADLDRERFSFASFYARRVRRIFPALGIVLLVCLAYGLVALLPSELADLGRDTAAAAGFLSNILLWQETGYFDRAAVAKPLLHLWSLGVEEQFYIFWPAALWFLYNLRRNRTGFIAAIAVVSFVASIVLSQYNQAADFYSPFTRFWELAAGALLVRRAFGLTTGARDTMSVVGLVLIVAASIMINANMRFPGWLAVLPVGGAVALIAAGPAARVNRVILSNRVAVWIGLISYPLYLWHWPLLSYATIIGQGRAPKPLVAVALVAIAFVLAWLTYRFVERPVRFSVYRRGTVLASVAMLGLVGAAGAVAWRAQGFASRFPDLTALNIAKINAAIGDGIFRPTAGMRVRNQHGVQIAEIGQGRRGVLLAGDSLLFQYGPRVQALLDAGRLTRAVTFVVGPSCAPNPGLVRPPPFANCSDLPGMMEDQLKTRDFDTVVLGGFWPGFTGEHVVIERGGKRLKGDAPEAREMATMNLEDQVRALMRQGHRVFLVLTPPADQRFNPRRMVTRSWSGFSIDPDTGRDVPKSDLVGISADANRRLMGVASRTGAGILDPWPDICGTDTGCSAFFGEAEPKFADDKHLRPMFVRDHITFLDEIFTAKP